MFSRSEMYKKAIENAEKEKDKLFSEYNDLLLADASINERLLAFERYREASSAWLTMIRKAYNI